MKFFSVIPLIAAAIVAAQDNSFSQPQPGDEIRAGDAYVIRWNATTDGQVQLVLLQGKSDNLSPVLTISDGIDNRGAVRWIVPDSLADGDNYALRINPVGKADDINYTGQFKITGGKAANTTTEAAASASASANATSSAEQTSSASAVVPVTSGANSSTTVPVASTVANTSTEAASTESSTASAVTTSIVGAGVSNGTGNGTVGTSSRASGSASRTTLTGSTARASGSASRSSGSAAAGSATGSAGASASRAPTNGGVVNSQNLGLVGVAAGIAALMM